MCQFEEEVAEYLNCVKGLYKDLVCVAKDSETNEIKVKSFAFKINKVTGNNTTSSLQSFEEHP